MYGTKGRIGLAVLDSDLTIEPDLGRILPDGVAVHASRVSYPHEVTVVALEAAQRGLEQAVHSLLPVRPDSIVWACTSGSFFRGRSYHERLLRDLLGWSNGVPSTTASNAVVEALRALGVRRPAVGAPYAPNVNEKLHHFLEEYGFEPTGVEGLNLEVIDDIALQSVDEAEVAAFVRRIDSPDADAIVVSCTGLPTSSIVADLEAELGKPVISSNLAILWHAFKIGGIAARPFRAGQLFEVE